MYLLAMITFKTYEERMLHPQAKLIPESMWNNNNLFNFSLAGFILPLMTASNEELITHLNDAAAKLDSNRLKKVAWLSIALGHPNFELSILRNLATQLQLNNLILFQLLVIIGNKKYLDDFLNESLPTNVQKMIQSENFYAYRLAAENGHLEVLQYLEAKVPNQIQEMIQGFDFCAYRLAAENGHLEVLKHLESKVPNQIQQMIQANDFFAYHLAAGNGHLEVLKHLESKVPNQIQDMIQAYEFYVYGLTAGNGHLEVLKHLESKVPNQIQTMIQANDFLAYRLAARNGHLVLQYLESVAPDQIQDMIQARDFSAYRLAAERGHLGVLQYLEAKAPNHIQNMIQACDFFAYWSAAGNGHLEVLQYLEAKAPNHIQDMIQANNFHAYQFAAENGHLEVSKSMFSKSSACFAHAEMHMNEYGELLIKPFVGETLHALRQATMDAPADFNITDSEQAKICFYIMRNLIRRNDRTLDNDLRFLLSIPAVQALAHQEVTRERPNELIRLALATNNQQAASILLTIPAVRELAEQNDYYRREAQGGLDLATLARDRESSMTALTEGEQRRLEAVTTHYQPRLKDVGVPAVMDDLRQQLRERYEANPASIEDKEGKTIKLPMDVHAFKALNLDPDDYQKALIAYYQHKVHSAWRYLAKPNPWMNPEAAYVYINDTHTERWSTFEGYQDLISLLWLAASDDKVPPTEDYTLEGRMVQFIDELAMIGRAHNWDSTRINKQGKEEHFDDLTGDRPSCFSGMKRRLFQSVLGHPLISILTKDMILEEIRTFARDHFVLQITTNNKKQLQNAFDDFFRNTTDLSEDNKKCLAALNISNEKLQEFESKLAQKYGTQFSQDLSLQKLVREKLFLKPESKAFSDHYHALMLDGVLGLYQMLSQPEPTKVSEAGFYSRTPNQQKESTDQVEIRPPSSWS
jgi:hypothetical protein